MSYQTTGDAAGSGHEAAPVAVQIMSDLHLETPKFFPMYSEMHINPTGSTLALLGDVGVADDDRLFEFLSRQLREFATVLYILGNHEPYGSTRENALLRMESFEAENHAKRELSAEQDSQARLGRFVLLNRKRYDLSPQVTVLGCTLFSRISDAQQSTASLFVSDFSNISEWTVDTHNTAHQTDLAWLNSEVEAISREEPHRKVVILTHYSPTMAAEANDPEHLVDSRGVQSAFVSDLAMEPCWTSNSVKVWAFGHTHFNCDYVDQETGKRVFANQRGYGREDIFDFDESKVISL